MCLKELEVTRICVTAHRPWGRQRFTVAHELGHYFLKHGSQIDTVLESREVDGTPDEEILADGFARYLLMPPRAVAKAFDRMNIYDGVAIFKASCWLGVGYESLIRQLCSSLRLISEERRERLLKVSRQRLGQELLGDRSFKADVWPLGEAWRERVVHVQVGDALIGICGRESSLITAAQNGVGLVKEPGEGTATLKTGGQVTVRASRRNYIGFYDYRYLPE